MKTLKRNSFIASLAILLSCGPSTKETLSSDNYVKWTKDIQITPDLFQKKGPEFAYSMWIGFYFIYDQSSDTFKFNVTTFMDKEKSYFDKVNKLEDTDTIKFSPELFKLRFDYYEIHARRLRKFILENKTKLKYESRDKFESLTRQYQQDAEIGWKSIQAGLETHKYNDEVLRHVQSDISNTLDELNDFDSTVNNYE